MLYSLFKWLEMNFEPPGIGAFAYITTRSAFAAATALIISLLIGKWIIRRLEKMQLKEVIRDDIGLDAHMSKGNTPTMGGIILLLATLIPAILWMNPSNIYMWLLLFVTFTMGLVGFVDDYIKVIKKNKRGLLGRFKIAGQITIALILGLILYFYPDFEAYNTLSTVPFVKNVNINYAVLGESLGWVIYIPVVIFIITGTSNAVNLTDGLDGLATGIAAISGLVFALMAYVSGRVDFSNFLDILYLPGASEITIFCAALVGACLGFLWYNTHPAQVFMGDTGSLALGGSLGAIALMLHKELLLPIVCGVFFFETLSVIFQTGYFKYTKKREGDGKSLFLMTPIHHHFEKKGWAEPKIVVRFWIIAALLAIISLLTFKLR